MPCNDSGFTDPEISAKWGVVDFDWSNAKRDWTLAKPMDCEERLVAQAKLVKSVNPDAKVWVYRSVGVMGVMGIAGVVDIIGTGARVAALSLPLSLSPSLALSPA